MIFYKLVDISDQHDVDWIFLMLRTNVVSIKIFFCLAGGNYPIAYNVTATSTKETRDTGAGGQNILITFCHKLQAMSRKIWSRFFLHYLFSLAHVLDLEEKESLCFGSTSSNVEEDSVKETFFSIACVLTWVGGWG